MYPPPLAKARALLGYGLEWKNKAAAQATRGLARGGKRVHEPEPAASGASFVTIVSRNSLTAALAPSVCVIWPYL